MDDLAPLALVFGMFLGVLVWSIVIIIADALYRRRLRKGYEFRVKCDAAIERAMASGDLRPGGIIWVDG